MNDSKCNFEVQCKVSARLKYRLNKNKRASQRAQFVRQIKSLPCRADGSNSWSYFYILKCTCKNQFHVWRHLTRSWLFQRRIKCNDQNFNC